MREIRFKKSKKTGKAGRLKTQSEVAKLLDISEDKLREYRDAGLPWETEPLKQGQSYTFDLGDVFKWIIAYERAVLEDDFAEAAAKGDGDGKEPKEEADRRRAVALANIAEIEEAKEAGAVVPIEAVITMVTEDYALLRAGLENIGNQLADRTAPITNPAQVQAIADKLVRKTVSKLVPRIPGVTPDDEEDDDDSSAAA